MNNKQLKYFFKAIKKEPLLERLYLVRELLSNTNNTKMWSSKHYYKFMINIEHQQALLKHDLYGGSFSERIEAHAINRRKDKRYD